MCFHRTEWLQNRTGQKFLTTRPNGGLGEHFPCVCGTFKELCLVPSLELGVAGQSTKMLFCKELLILAIFPFN